MKNKKTKTINLSREIINEMMIKHREVKCEILALTGKIGMGTISKQTIADELFKIYLKIK